MKEQMGHSSIQVTADIYHHYVHGSNKQAVDRLDEPVDNPKTEVASTIAVTRKKWVRWKRSGVHQNLLKTMKSATGIEPATCGLRITYQPLHLRNFGPLSGTGID